MVGRIRPLAKYEIENGSRQIVSALPPAEPPLPGLPSTEPELLQVKTHGADKRFFELDAVFDKESTQEDVYVRSGAKQAVVEDIFKGFNCTILAYGQTGAGKTFTMGTASGGSGTDLNENDGVIPRACADLFEGISRLCDSQATVQMQFIEVYNEEIRDLLTDDETAQSALRIRETMDGEVYVRGLQARTVSSPAEIGKLMDEASSRRVVASTKMNATSSRSHAICVLRINGVLEDASKFNAKLTLVDLAGSERIKKTGADGGRAKEGININKGLFVLGQVVSALSEQRKKMQRKPPYRDSKLTRLLQDSLGGNSRTIMIACVSPADFNVDESINTLRYATSARNIKNTATRNVVQNLSPEEAAKLQRENQLLKEEVKQLQEKIRSMLEENDSNDNNEQEAAESSKETSDVGEDTQERANQETTGNVSFDLAAIDISDGGAKPEKKTYEELEKEVGHLKRALHEAKADVRASTRETIELPAMKVQVAQLEDELNQSRYMGQALEEEAEMLSEELLQAKAEASSAKLAAERFRLFMESSQSSSTFNGDQVGDFDSGNKEVEIKKEQEWVYFSVKLLQTFREQMRLLGDYFEMVVRVVEDPDITHMLPKSAQQRRGVLGFGFWNQAQDHEGQDELRKKLLLEHVKFFQQRFLDIEDEITRRSDAVEAISDGFENDQRRLDEEGGDFEESLKESHENLLPHLTELLTGPLIVW